MMNDVLSQIDPEQIILNNSINSCSYSILDEFNSNCLNTNFDSCLLKMNFQSFNAKEPVMNFLTSSLQCKPSFLCISETWNNENIVNSCTLDGYSAVRTHQPENDKVYSECSKFE